MMGTKSGRIGICLGYRFRAKREQLTLFQGLEPVLNRKPENRSAWGDDGYEEWSDRRAAKEEEQDQEEAARQVQGYLAHKKLPPPRTYSRPNTPYTLHPTPNTLHPPPCTSPPNS